MQNMLAYEIVIPHLKCLRAVGFYQIDPNRPKINRYIHRAYMSFVMYLLLFYTGQEIIHIYQVKDNAGKIMDTLFLMLTYSDCIYKEYVMWKQQDKIEDLLNMLKSPLFNQDGLEHQILLLKQKKKSKLLLRLFLIAALSTCFMWMVFPVIKYAQGKHVEFTIWLPFEPNMSPNFYIALVYVWAQTSLLAIGNVSMDAFISLFFAQSKTQLMILRFNLDNMVKTCQAEAKDKSIPFAKIFHQRFQITLLHYTEIALLCKKTQSIFGGAILYFFLIGTWIICTSAYRMLSSELTSLEFISMIIYMTCVLSEIYLYCYYGSEVAYESNKIMDSVYAMDWYDIPLQQRYPVIIFMERIKRPIVPMAGSIIPLSNNTFVSILRSSYTFYAFLKNSNK